MACEKYFRELLLAGIFMLGILGIVASGGGSSSSSDSPQTSVPISVSLKNVALSAGVPTTITYTIPAPDKPYTDVTIDLAKTLEAANIILTPTP